MNKISLLLIPILFVIVLLVSVPDADAQKIISKNMEITLNSAGYAAITGQINQCGEALQFSFYIDSTTNKINYDWKAIPEIKCNGITYKFHHVFLEVWEGEADNIHDIHEMFYSSHIKPVRENKDYSRLIDPLDIVGLRAAFIFT